MKCKFDFEIRFRFFGFWAKRKHLSIFLPEIVERLTTSLQTEIKNGTREAEIKVEIETEMELGKTS